jgi:hypothetical protein
MEEKGDPVHRVAANLHIPLFVHRGTWDWINRVRYLLRRPLPQTPSLLKKISETNR